MGILMRICATSLTIVATVTLLGVFCRLLDTEPPEGFKVALGAILLAAVAALVVSLPAGVILLIWGA